MMSGTPAENITTMSGYSLLQQSLDQTIDRETLEEASVVARSVARTDCAKMQRELFGILVSNLEKEEAMAFQTELKRVGFPTELVADDDLPILHDKFTVQRVEVQGENLLFTDSMGRLHLRPLKDLVFLAGGHVDRITFKESDVLKIDFDGRAPRLVSERKTRDEKTTEFLLDFFFWTSPNRFRLSLTEGTTIFHEGQPLRLRQKDEIRLMKANLLRLLPPQRVSRGMETLSDDAFYPNSVCYEEEIRWHFHQLKSAG